MLDKTYPGMVDFLLNNRWQFFYKKTEWYSDDFRFIGEHPLPFDKMHLSLLKKIMGIDIAISNSQSEHFNFLMDKFFSNEKIMFINKFDVINDNLPLKKRNCVSTVVVKNINCQEFVLKTFDEDMPSNINIKHNKLYKMWQNASEHTQLNSCEVKINFSNSLNLFDARRFAKTCLIKSIREYIDGDLNSGYCFGNFGLRQFAKDIVNWNPESYGRFIDCSLYLNAVVKQRIVVSAVLQSILGDIFPRIISNINENIDEWNKLKMNLYIVGMRRQTGNISQLAEIINKLAKQELALINDINEVLDGEFN